MHDTNTSNEGKDFDFNYENPTAEQLFELILFRNKEYEKSVSLKGIRKNFVYTIKSFSLDSITSDDNGAYRNSTKVGQYYYVDKILDNQKPSVLKVQIEIGFT